MYVEALSVCVFGSKLKREHVKDSTKPFGASFVVFFLLVLLFLFLLSDLALQSSSEYLPPFLSK